MFPDVTESIRQTRVWLFRQPRFVLAGVFIGGLVLIWAVYAPAFQSIRRSHAEWLRLKTELIDVRKTVDPIRRGEVPLLPRADAISTVLKQLNTVARSKQIQFIQVSPGAARAGDPPGLVILPVELTLEGVYRSWGEFLGALARTPSLSGTFVRQLSIDREERLLPHLRGRLSLEIFLSEAESGS
ncbi:MAG: type 4a pilus biogenesis protein PilO [Candidatus Omnitrophica bacterium]|nr:type 4a pilus biogenesis protein PilO [Candidatus Omnitrophota bacterium]